MIKERNKRLAMVRGDSAHLRVHMKGYKLEDGDLMELTIADKLTLELEDGAFTFEPQDTADWDAGLYPYDIQVTTYDGEVHTLVKNYINIIEGVNEDD